ncbi:hypothetical protein DL764_007463 [Monosporascus ibericus]|uniref:Uncharacterized protein n=1 Tax=Monosporascus ibericus TaxID=155417 RepID=A0A4Q4T0K2_9PEZI|nr:hypothetical protein DL764_007463 [Monosporascus ibericus]
MLRPVHLLNPGRFGVDAAGAVRRPPPFLLLRYQIIVPSLAATAAAAAAIPFTRFRPLPYGFTQPYSLLQLRLGQEYARYAPDPVADTAFFRRVSSLNKETEGAGIGEAVTGADAIPDATGEGHDAVENTGLGKGVWDADVKSPLPKVEGTAGNRPTTVEDTNTEKPTETAGPGLTEHGQKGRGRTAR